MLVLVVVAVVVATGVIAVVIIEEGNGCNNSVNASSVPLFSKVIVLGIKLKIQISPTDCYQGKLFALVSAS